jgi:HEAT repeat protein
MKKNLHVVQTLFLAASLVLFGCQPTGSSPERKSQESKTDRSTQSNKSRKASKPEPATTADVPRDAYENTAEAIEELLEAAKASDTRTFDRAETWLVRQSDAAIDPLSQILNDEQTDLRLRIAVCRPLRKLGPGAVPVFKQALESPLQQIQLKAIEGLGLVRPASADTIETLNRLLDSEEQRLRREAILALANIGPPAEDACAERLIAILNDANENQVLRDAAKRALEEVNPRHSFAD